MRDIHDYTNTYSASPFEDWQVHFRKRQVITLIEKYAPFANILEVGCALSPLFEAYTNFKNLTIVEPSPVFAKLAREKAANLALSQVTVCEALFEEAVLPKDANFDMILLSGLLHELTEPQLDSVLATTQQYCNPQTVVHINVPNAHSLHRVLAMESGLIPSVFESSENQRKLQQYRIFSLATLQEKVEAAGFELIDKGSFFVKPFTHAQMASLLEQNIIPEQVLYGFEKLIKYMPELGSEIYVNVRKK
jgi:hypothetical protein